MLAYTFRSIADSIRQIHQRLTIMQSDLEIDVKAAQTVIRHGKTMLSFIRDDEQWLRELKNGAGQSNALIDEALGKLDTAIGYLHGTVKLLDRAEQTWIEGADAITRQESPQGAEVP